MARHMNLRLKDGSGVIVRHALTEPCKENPLTKVELLIVEQYDRIQELEKRPSRLALYGRLIESYGKSKANTYKRDVYDWLIERMQREENNQ